MCKVCPSAAAAARLVPGVLPAEGPPALGSGGGDGGSRITVTAAASPLPRSLLSVLPAAEACSPGCSKALCTSCRSAAAARLAPSMLPAAEARSPGCGRALRVWCASFALDAQCLGDVCVYTWAVTRHASVLQCPSRMGRHLVPGVPDLPEVLCPEARAPAEPTAMPLTDYDSLHPSREIAECYSNGTLLFARVP